MNIVHIIDVANSKGNGVAVAVTGYLNSQKKHHNVCLYNLNDKLDIKDVPCYSFEKYKAIARLPYNYSKPDLVIFNEVYKPKYMLLYNECLLRKIPYVIIPHGCLVSEAQKKSKWKKKIFNFILFNRFIKKASAIHFLNEKEKQKSNFKYKKAIISGNGVDTPNYHNNCNENGDIVYIGRYDVMTKGLDLLTKVCYENKKWFEEHNVKVQLYGRNSGNGMELLEQYIHEYGIQDILKINDAVFGEEKEKVLQNACLFIQLSRHEGQPMGIIEAASVGVPCIVTYGTTFGEYLNQNKCGIGVNFDEDEVFDAIKEMYENKEKRREYSKKAIKVVNEEFNWDRIMQKLFNEYEEIIK